MLAIFKTKAKIDVKSNLKWLKDAMGSNMFYGRLCVLRSTIRICTLFKVRQFFIGALIMIYIEGL